MCLGGANKKEDWSRIVVTRLPPVFVMGLRRLPLTLVLVAQSYVLLKQAVILAH